MAALTTGMKNGSFSDFSFVKNSDAIHNFVMEFELKNDWKTIIFYSIFHHLNVS